jgi:hypothetical protein
VLGGQPRALGGLLGSQPGPLSGVLGRYPGPLRRIARLVGRGIYGLFALHC